MADFVGFHLALLPLGMYVGEKLEYVGALETKDLRLSARECIGFDRLGQHGAVVYGELGAVIAAQAMTVPSRWRKSENGSGSVLSSM